VITNLVDKQSYAGNGSNVNFAIPFAIIVSDVNEVGVILRDITIPGSPVDTTQVYGAGQNYTLTGATPPTNPFNTTVVMKVAPTSNQIVVIYRVMPLTQLLSMVASSFDFSNLNIVHDRIVAMAQVLNEIINRAPLLAQATQRTAPDYIPEPAANTLLGYDINKKLNLFPNPSAGNVGVLSLNGLQGIMNIIGSGVSISGNNILISPGAAPNRVLKTSAYQILVTDYYVGAGVLSAPVTFTLPLASAAGSGFICVIKDEAGGANANNITIAGKSSDLIDGQATQVMAQNFDSITLFCTGTGWAIC